MPDLSPQQIVEWFRNQAAEFNKMADNVERTFKLQPSANGRKSNFSVLAQPRNGTVTEGQLVESVKQKAGRVNDLADRFNVDSFVIQHLINQPDSKVYSGERGWLKVKE